MVTVLLAVAFFTHFFLPRTEPEIALVKEKRSEVSDKIDAAKDEILKGSLSFVAGGLDQNKFDDLVTSNNAMILELEKEHESLLNEFERLDSHYKAIYFNYPNRRSLMWSLGLGIIISVLSVRLMQKSHETKDENRKNADMVESFMGGIIGAYFFAWILDPVDRLDLPYAWYITLTVLLGVLGATLGFFITKVRHNKVSILKEKINFLQQMVESLFKMEKETK